MQILGHYIGGQTIPDDNRLADVYDPALGRVVRRVAMASPGTVRDAVSATGCRAILYAAQDSDSTLAGGGFGKDAVRVSELVKCGLEGLRLLPVRSGCFLSG